MEKHKDNVDPPLLNFHIAREAFLHFGFHIMDIDKGSDIPTDDTDCVAVGSIQYIKTALQQLGYHHLMT